ncbi:MAG: DUF6383 domain-containing protein [Massilibacteroides sp.]|nr:DUF6383 domain-containing protein [Massilibacteroides sp.]
MNKRFSTLLAALTVASGFSFSAMAAGPGDVKSGDYIYLQYGSTNNVYLNKAAAPASLDGEASTAVINANAFATGKGFDDLDKQLWQVFVKETQTTSGIVKTYQFVNKYSKELLAFKLATDNGGVTSAVAKIDPTGNSLWSWSDAKGLYAIKYETGKDSIFYLGSDFKLHSVAGTDLSKVTGSLLVLTATSPTEEINLTAYNFNSLLARYDKQLFFNNGKDVSTGETNALTGVKWTALPFGKPTLGTLGDEGEDTYAAPVDSTDYTKFYLWNGETVKGGTNDLSAANLDKKKFLVIDYTYYDVAKTLPKLVVDTVSYEPIYNTAGVLSAASDATAFATRTTAGKRHPFTAGFTGKYNIAKDSLVITSVTAPKKLVLAPLDHLATKAGYTSGTTTAFDQLVTAVQSFGGQTLSADETFAAAHFDATAYTYHASVGTAGSDLIIAAQTYVTGLSSSSTTDKKAEKQAFIDALGGLKYTQTTTSFSTDNYLNDDIYSDGIQPLQVEAVTGNTKEVVLAKLSNTYVLTAVGTTTDYVKPLIQPFAKASSAGDAQIDVTKIYYVKNLSKIDEETFGKFYDWSPVNVVEHFVDAEQPFNPYAQFVVEKASGIEKGYYTITNRANTAKLFVGVTNTVKDNDGKAIAGQYIIAGDTIGLVEADVDGDDVYVGFKNFTEAEITNKAYKVQTSSPLLGKLFINTVSATDSSLTLKENEVLYRMEEAVAATAYGKAEIEGVAKQLKAAQYKLYTKASATATAGKEYLAYDATTSKLYLTTASAKAATFAFVETGAAGNYVLAEGSSAYKIAVNAQTARLYPAAMNAKNDLFSIAEEDAPQSFFTLPKHIQLKGLNGDMIAVGENNFAKVARVGDLKSAYEEADFTFFLDTASYTVRGTRKDVVTSSYYISKGADAKRLYLYAAADSAANAKVDKTDYTYNSLTRLQFRNAQIVNFDTLKVWNGDTEVVVSIAEKKVDGKVVVAPNVKDYRFQFILDEESGAYIVKSEGRNTYMKSVNGVAVLDATLANAMRVNLEGAETPTSNAATPEAATFSVFSGAGSVTISGAAGKSVVVSNILGQTIASTVLTSDYETIAAPKGIVIVAVAGEEAVKAVVK